MNYVIGLDIGIGSVGWSVIRNDEDVKRIEDFGVRIFESGEDPKTKNRESQKRRAKRSIRRLVRRRSHRKYRLKNHLENIRLISNEEINEYFEHCSCDIIGLRLKALDEQITPAELAACLINICNRRGYRDFYQPDFDNMEADEIKEYQEEHEAIGIVQEIMEKGKYRTVAEMIAKDDYFNVENSQFKRYRNSQYNPEKILITREMMEEETDSILQSQRKYYPQLTDTNIDKIKTIIFSQRDFEDGPGDSDDKYREYMGFIDSMGNCSFYKEERRGCRFTILADLYSLTNVLSQSMYVNKTTGEIALSKELANTLLDTALRNGKITKAEIKKIADLYDCDVNIYDDGGEGSISKCLKFITSMKRILEANGYDWYALAKEYADTESLINRISKVLSENITPKRRVEALKQISELTPGAIEDMKGIRASGTAAVCYRYMLDSINAFLNGESYGNFQARFNKEADDNAVKKKYDKLPTISDSDEFYNNTVVLRSINETRKIINAIVTKYGTPSAINIETSTDLNKSKKSRDAEAAEQRKNSKFNDEAVKAVAEIVGCGIGDVKPSMVERYKLGEEQKWKCLYSGDPINDKREAILNTSHFYEVDHIIPFSLILDNTLANKALVKHSENQDKGQHTPLMYMNGEQAKGYKARVNSIYGKKPQYKKKYKYLMLADLYDEGLLSEWKSRNINDTRYISKYLVRYLENTLKFTGTDKRHVYAVKGAITSMMRRQWLNENTWGIKDKQELKKVTHLDHAVDAIVIANCIPAYVELVSLNRKLKDIYYSSGKTYTDEYNGTLAKGIESLERYYGMSRRVSEPLLRKIKVTPSLVPNLREEVDIRVCDCDMERYFDGVLKKKIAKLKEEGKELPDYSERSDDELSDDAIKENFRKLVNAYYKYDSEFAAGVRMPLVSFKQDKKVNKGIGNDTLLSVRSVNGEEFCLHRKAVDGLKKKDIPAVYTNDSSLLSVLNSLMSGYGDEDTVRKALDDKNTACFTVGAQRVNSVKLKTPAPKTYLVKEISENNRSYLDVTSYYCVEIYLDTKGKTQTTAIPYAFLKVVDGKLCLSENYRQPENYAAHVTYLFPNDYVVITKKNGEEKFSGYYKGVFNINQSKFNFIANNSVERTVKNISQSDKVTRRQVDILGIKGRKDIKCGEPLPLIREKS